MTVLIDSNIILDYVLKREPDAQAALDCLSRLFMNKDTLCISASMITDIYYVARRSLQDRTAAKNVIAKLLNSFHIVAVDKADCVNALNMDSNDYEDALVSIWAKKAKAEYIITRNDKHFMNSAVPAITPLAFMQRFFP